MEKRERRAMLRGAAAGALATLAVCLLLGVLLLPGYSTSIQTMLKLGQILDIIDRRYVGEYDGALTGDYAAYAIMQSLDDRYSSYLPADAVEEYEANKYGETFGVGIQCIWDEERQAAHVYRVLEGSSAKEEGIEAGDWIVAAGETTGAEDGFTALIEAIRGEEGTTVEVTVEPADGGEAFTVKVERRRMTQLMAEGELLADNTGLIRIFSFHQGAEAQFRAAYDSLKAEGMERLVIDVRHDGGGLVSEMVAIADIFLPECDVMVMRSKSGKEERRRSSEQHDELPLAVLVDEQSYSAAEFFAALMQEYGRALTVGVQTTGKERAQNTYRLIDGSEIVLSDQQYMTPEGRALGETGMTPDIEVGLPEEVNFYFMTVEDDPQLAAALAAFAE